jgi:hypothetical protein
MNEIYALAQRRSAIAGRLFMVVAVLLVMDIIMEYLKHDTGRDFVFGLVRLFDLDGEANVPSFFSTLLLMSASILLWLISREEKNRGGRDAGRWKVLAVVFLYLAVDEAAMLHELFIVPGGELLGKDRLGIFNFAWVIPYSVLVLVLGAYFIGFFLRLPAVSKIRFVVAAVLFVGGSLGFEFIEGAVAKAEGENSTAYWVLSAIEEGMEMAGVIVFIHALLEYIAVNLNGEVAVTAAPIMAGAIKAQD